MADDEKVSAERLAAAKKRVAQLQKQKSKKADKKTASSGEPNQDSTVPVEAAAKEEIRKDGDPENDELEVQGRAEDTGKWQHESRFGDKDVLEPMPDAPTTPDADGIPEDVKDLPSRGAHSRQPSLSLQSKMRSSSFRKSSISHGATTPPMANFKPSALPPLNPADDSIHEVFRKQAARLEELERENRRLEREIQDMSARNKKTEEQLEDFREANVGVVELKDRLRKAEQQAAEVERLRSEITSLQRQNSHLQSKSHRNTNSISISGTLESLPSDLAQQLESKSATIEAMELEISNLRAQIHTQSNSNISYQTQIEALKEKVSQDESALERTQRELADTKRSLNRAADKAMKEGVDKASTETLIKSLRREVGEIQQAENEAQNKVGILDKKLQALGNLHKESEARHFRHRRDIEKLEKDLLILRTSAENENRRLREERDLARHQAAVGGADEGLDELEDEERSRLERRVRELEGEIFDLRRGFWQEKKIELASDHDVSREASTSPANAFDEVDLTGGAPSHSRRRSTTAGRPQQHSSFTTVLSSGLAAFTGTSNWAPRPSHPLHPPIAPGRGSLELLSENDDVDFDEEAFVRAQAEEEARKRVGWMREVKRKLRDWKGWRLDLVDSRAGAEGAGVGMGEIFEV